MIGSGDDDEPLISAFAPLAPDWKPTKLDVVRPHPARIYDYFLGGQDNFSVDRAAADHIIAAMPSIVTAARICRRFLARVVRHLIESGITQFVDIGTGIPAVNPVHQVAQSMVSRARVVYVDNDPMVLNHARAILTPATEGTTAYVLADLREPEAILSEARKTIDFEQPVAVLLLNVLHFVPEVWQPQRLVRALTDATPAGSYLAISHATGEYDADNARRVIRAYQRSSVPAVARSADDLTRMFFAGLELVEPGVVLISDWRPQPDDPRLSAAEISIVGGLARKR